MSGHGTLASDKGSGERIDPRPRRRTIIAAVGTLALVMFGAVAQADDGDPDRDGPRAAAVATTEAGGGVVGDSVPPGDPPTGLGDDPQLDALAVLCFGGDLLACDRLFLQSAVDSEYETYGDTCGGRQEAGTENYCGLESGADDPVEPDTPVNPTPPDGLGTDPALDALANECYAGDMDACDELYDAAEDDSGYKIYGDTCGGRQPENTGRYCRDLDSPVPGTGPISSTPDDTTPVDTGVVSTANAPDDTTPVDTGVVDSTPDSQPVIGGEIPPATEQPVGLGTDPGLDALAQGCFDGDMDACDELYNSSEPDTQYRRYGDTCAGRQPEDTGVWCRNAFGSGSSSTDVTSPVPTAPPSTMPIVPVPPVTVPPITVPPITVPPMTVPPLTVPQVTTPGVPPITLPNVPTLPAITVPGPTLPGPTLPGPTLPVGVIPPPTLQPVGLGTTPEFDALAQSCYNGDMASCDELFRQSDPEVDTSYRDYGDTCAGRQPAGTGRWCEASFPASGATTTLPGNTLPGTVTTPGTGTVAVGGIPPATQQPTGLGNDPQLNTLAQSCYDGAMQACDDLFLQSELGSPYHEYGDTCAGRQGSGTYTYCHVAFPTSQP